MAGGYPLRPSGNTRLQAGRASTGSPGAIPSCRTMPQDSTAVYANYDGLGDGSPPEVLAFADILPGGLRPPATGAFGQMDLAGSMWEWTLDWGGFRIRHNAGCVAGLALYQLCKSDSCHEPCDPRRELELRRVIHDLDLPQRIQRPGVRHWVSLCEKALGNETSRRELVVAVGSIARFPTLWVVRAQVPLVLASWRTDDGKRARESGRGFSAREKPGSVLSSVLVAVAVRLVHFE